MVANVKQYHTASCDKLGSPRHTFDWEIHNEMKQHYLSSNPNPRRYHRICNSNTKNFCQHDLVSNGVQAQKGRNVPDQGYHGNLLRTH